MIFLSHRGLWTEREDANSIKSLDAALQRNFGVEVDVRDSEAELVIAHDVVDGPKPSLADLLSLPSLEGRARTLAINIKADGLASRIKSLVVSHGVTNYFCFDMSTPEMLQYCRMGLRYFSRHSEHEPSPVLYGDAAGVWMDMFESDWITASDIRGHLDCGKQVAIVSPELHHRPHKAFWDRLLTMGLTRHAELMLCTDHPDYARSFFDA